ncbi:MAG: transcriptional repressor LexA [Desulfobulbus sp.]|nr:transcriptional repressor LexA [Desulfobulbus sp.]
MPKPLTPRQREFFTYLQDLHSADHGIPSLRQVASDLGVSHTAVASLLQTLQDKGWIRRDGRYSRQIILLEQLNPQLPEGGRLVPIIGRVAAGLPLYAQQEWAGEVLVDSRIYRGEHLFALRVDGYSMRNSGILAGDLAICEPRQFASNGEIVVALINNEEATVKRFYFLGDVIELRPENEQFSTMRYALGEVLIQGKVIGIHRGPEEMASL